MILDFISPLTNFVNNLADILSAGDGVAKGMISVAVMGGLVALFRHTPRKLFHAFLRLTTVSIRVDDTWRTEDKRMYWRISEFITENTFSRNMRMFNPVIMGSGQSKTVKYFRGPQPGNGFFIKGMRPFWYAYEQGRENGAVPEAITLSTFGRNEDKILELVKVKAAILENDGVRYYKENTKEDWVDVGAIEATAPIFLAPHIKELLDKKIQEFIASAAWCRERGLSHKLLVIPYGEPGTGKSSVGRYIAEKLGYSLGTMRSATGFTKDMRSAAANSIVVSIPDFDSLAIANARSSEKKSATDVDKHVAAIESVIGNSMLSEVLNLFEGDIPIHNLVCVMSTNHISKIDPALYRGSRCDLLIELPALTYAEINDFQKFYYNTDTDFPVAHRSVCLVASDVMGTFRDHRNDRARFIEDIVRKSDLRSLTGSSFSEDKPKYPRLGDLVAQEDSSTSEIEELST